MGGESGLGECLAEIYGFKGAVLDKRKADDSGANVSPGAQLGTPTISINNAAVLHGKPFLDLTMEDIERTFRTNTLSHYHLTSLFLRPFISRPGGGTLVTISSVLAHVGASRLSDYTASKSALIAFHSSPSAELASTPNIKTMLVTPGQLDTEIFKAVRLGWVQKFFAPVVEWEGGVLAVPAYARWIAWMAVLPAGVQNVLRSWSGIDEAMSGFSSRRKNASLPPADDNQLPNM